MVRAILAGRKTQTRRVVKLPASLKRAGGDLDRAFADLLWGVTPGLHVPCGDVSERLRNPWNWPNEESTRLWVREAWAAVDFMVGVELDDPVAVAYRADRKVISHEAGNVRPIDTYAWNWDRVKWKPSIFMPRWASRITLEVIGVRAERLQDISAADVEAEGFYPGGELGRTRACFATGWDKLNGKRGFGWETNSWVWVVDFEMKGGSSE
jgi:hypothetical protein